MGDRIHTIQISLSPTAVRKQVSQSHRQNFLWTSFHMMSAPGPSHNRYWATIDGSTPRCDHFDEGRTGPVPQGAGPSASVAMLWSGD
jgi:hypothetical protein